LSESPIGVMLLAFGGPDCPEAIEPFMKNLMGGRVPPPALVEKIKARYDLIGGSSPLPGITGDQAAKLEEYLNTNGGNYRVVVGMRHWRPFIQEAVEKLVSQGVNTIVAVSLAPFYSHVSTGTYLEELNRVVSSMGDKILKVVTTKPFYDKPVFHEAVAEKLTQAIKGLPEENKEKVRIIFSAHSLPVSCIEKGDPYVQEFELVVKRIAKKLGLSDWHIAYQSKGGGQGEWLGPTVEEIMDNVKKEGFSDILVVPVGFVSDHIETLYDIDIAQKNHAVSAGLNFYRAGSLNTSGKFIQALAETVLESMNNIKS
jgi:ferrochelatase